MPATRSSSTARTPKQKQTLQITLPSRRSSRKSSPLPDSRVSKLSKPSDSSYLTIRSSNNAKVLVRSEVLRSYLPRLYNDYRANPERDITLPYSSQALLLIVGYLSRGSFQPSIDAHSYDHLGDCFHAATAYGLDSLTTWLRSELSHPRSAYYMGKSPIQAYSLCSIYDLKVEKKLAFNLCIGTIDFSNSSSLASVASKCQNSTVALDLISRLSRRNTIILEMFGALHTCPLDLRSYRWIDKIKIARYSDFTCSSCRDDIIFKVPSWIVYWTHFAKMELLDNPGAECEQVFRVDFMSKRRDGYDLFGDDEMDEEDRELEPSVCRGCLKKILIDNPSRWEDWAQEVEALLRKKLGDDF
ncbi:unnamed protein product [Rhizoctonia solani]|uniref:BTB domain-containing protein n=1 Tax=Rhizoctonia solani TaxID=456999 RepID=A0A8H2X926_9AGAM|nr:unnamed protein product [Rhizoctonia solani]